MAGSFLGGLASGAIGGAIVRLTLDDTGFKSGLASAETQTKTAGATTSKFAGLATAAYAAAGVAAVKFAADSIKAFSESQQVMAQTAAVIESTGGAAGFSADAIHGLAAALQDSTTFSDEQIQSAENLLLTFTNIGHETFPDATQAVLDMSQALGQDLKTSSIQLGKALNDPIAGLTSLSRVGVKFTQETKDQITTLVEQGKTLEAQKIILAELNNEFGGSAAAAAGTFEGKMAQLSNTFNDFQEVVGGKLVPVLTSMLDRLNTLAEMLPVIVPWIERFVGAVEEGIPVLNAYFTAIDEGNDDFAGFQAGLESVDAALESGEIGFDRAVDRVEALAEATGVELPEGAAAMVTAMREAEGGASSLSGATKQVATEMQRARKAAMDAAEEYRQGVKDAFQVSGEAVIGFKSKLAGTVRSFLTGLRDMRREAAETLKDLREFNKIDLGKGVKEFLLDQGPAAIDAFTDANKQGRERIVKDIRAIIDTQQAQGKEIDEATGKTKSLTGAMEALGRKKVTAEARIRYMLSEDSLDPGSLPGLSKAGT